MPVTNEKNTTRLLVTVFFIYFLKCEYCKWNLDNAQTLTRSYTDNTYKLGTVIINEDFRNYTTTLSTTVFVSGQGRFLQLSFGGKKNHYYTTRRGRTNNKKTNINRVDPKEESRLFGEVDDMTGNAYIRKLYYKGKTYSYCISYAIYSSHQVCFYHTGIIKTPSKRSQFWEWLQNGCVFPCFIFVCYSTVYQLPSWPELVTCMGKIHWKQNQ